MGAGREDLSPRHGQLPVGHRHPLSQPALTSRHLPAFLSAFNSPPSFLLGCLWEWISTVSIMQTHSAPSASQPKPLQTPLPPTPPQVLSRAVSVCVQNPPTAGDRGAGNRKQM